MNCNIFFDFDMTLGYRIMMWTATVRQLLLEHNIVVEESLIKPFTNSNGYPWNNPELSHEEFFNGKGWWENTEEFIVEGLLQQKICSEKIANEVAKQFKSRYKEKEYWRLFPDTIEVLTKLKNNGYNLYLLSNHVPEAREIIDNLGITKFFDDIFISAEIGYEKPNKKIFEFALSKAKKSQFNIMVGDNWYSDMEGAKLSNMYGILIRRPSKKFNGIYLNNLYELYDYLKDLMGKHYENR